MYATNALVRCTVTVLSGISGTFTPFMNAFLGATRYTISWTSTGRSFASFLAFIAVTTSLKVSLAPIVRNIQEYDLRRVDERRREPGQDVVDQFREAIRAERIVLKRGALTCLLLFLT